jgi:hypothetical protein
MGARVAEGDVALGHAADRFDEVGTLNEPNLVEEVRAVASSPSRLAIESRKSLVPHPGPMLRG